MSPLKSRQNSEPNERRRGYSFGKICSGSLFFARAAIPPKYNLPLIDPRFSPAFPRGGAIFLAPLPEYPEHKLHAVMNHDWPDMKKGFPLSYFQACGRWFAALSGDDKVGAFEKGDKAEAKKAASALSPAPVCPLL